ncbi:hypothetical protein Pfo_024165 [Paulownia fortunei]|nr:hypothetical protein Pfo_024165 [Paulownia fortunei]
MTISSNSVLCPSPPLVLSTALCPPQCFISRHSLPPPKPCEYYTSATTTSRKPTKTWRNLQKSLNLSLSVLFHSRLFPSQQGNRHHHLLWRLVSLASEDFGSLLVDVDVELKYTFNGEFTNIGMQVLVGNKVLVKHINF